MQRTDLFGQPASVEVGKGGKPRLVFGETPPPARREAIHQRPGQTPTPTAPGPAPLAPAGAAPVATPAPAGKALAARPAAERRRATAPPSSLARSSPREQYRQACVQAALLAHMLRVATAEVERLQAAAGGEAAPTPCAAPSALLDRAARTALGQPRLKAQVAFLTRAAGLAAPAGAPPAPADQVAAPTMPVTPAAAPDAASTPDGGSAEPAVEPDDEALL